MGSTTPKKAVVPEHVYAVILAGGSGTRFWPKSRLKSPKQLCKMGNSKKTMIEQTLARLDGFIPPNRRMIVTHKDQMAQTKKIVGGRCKYFLSEPEAKNTANALAIAALELKLISKKHPNPVMISLHADHLIGDEDKFRADLLRAQNIAEHGYITLVGIKPTHPETGYGYIEQGRAIGELSPWQGFQVASFREKPNAETAANYIKTGKFSWNSGYFIWQVDTILGELDAYLPECLKILRALIADKKKTKSFSKISPAAFAKAYRKLPNAAVDTAVLEKSNKIAFITADFDWNDIGSWDALEKSFAKDLDANGNLAYGKSLLIDTKNSVIDSTTGAFVACLGVSDLVVVSMKDAILVCPKDRAQDVKKIVEQLKAQGLKSLV